MRVLLLLLLFLSVGLCSPLAAGLSSLLLPASAAAAVIRVPADQPSIQSGINAAGPGDTVLVACGSYAEHDVVVRPGICLRSEEGAECTAINAGGLGRVLSCAGAGPDTRIEGFTLTGASLSEGYGGGLYLSSSSPTVSRCVFTGNLAFSGGSAVYCLYSNPLLKECRIEGNLRSIDGGGVYCNYSSPTLVDCVISGNWCMFWGGGIFCQKSSPHLIGCTLHGNRAQGQGGGIWCVYDSHPVLENTIISGSTEGEGIYLYDGGCTATVLCCDVFGNADGNYGGHITDPTGHDGNISADPLYCGPGSGDFHVAESSPCLPQNNSCGELIGALGEGCSMPAGIPEAPSSSSGLFGLRIINPFPRGGELTFILPAAARASLALYNCAGRRVATVLEGAVPAGPQARRWDGRDGAGRDLPPGVYFCRLSADGRTEVARLVLSR